MPGRALVVGIDAYGNGRDLSACVTDATKIASLLENHGNGDPNYDVKVLTSANNDVSASNIMTHVTQLFSSPTETALFYFAGHGTVDANTQKGFLETPDGNTVSPGIDISALLNLATEAYEKNIQSTVIILDCCQSGIAAQGRAYQGLSKGVSVIGDGVTILTASRSDQSATEDEDGHGTFTGILIDGLEGAASDVLGRITPAALSSYIEQSLGEWEQRPVDKANVQKFITVRKISPKVPIEVLRRIPKYFPTVGHVFKLDPTYEKDRGEETERLKHIPYSVENFAIFRELQKLQSVGLVKPSEHDFMWHSAIYSGGCRLTATGAHYRYLALNNRIR